MTDKMIRHYELLKNVARIPGQIVHLHGRENITEFVLHDLCNKNCFNLGKAGYFVDNPDFDSFKGVVGYHSNNAFVQPYAIWDDPDLFTKHMAQAPFNQKVRNLFAASPKRHALCDQNFVQEVAQKLELERPEYYCWPMKHDNYGLLVFEHVDDTERNWDAHDLSQAVHLLSLCPIF